MSSIGYGLRHRPTGRFVQLETSDNHGHAYAGEETCKLRVPEAGERGERFEVADLAELARVLRRDVQWYNTTRTRPGWGRVVLAECLPVLFERTAVSDPMGGDPVSVSERAHLMSMPTFLDARTLDTRQNGPASLMRRAFGEGYGAFEAMDGPVLAVVDVADGTRVLPGMLIETAARNTVQVAVVADLPDDWPLKGPDGLAARSGGFKLVACRWRDFELTEAAVPFEELPPTVDLGAFGRWG